MWGKARLGLAVRATECEQQGSSFQASSAGRQHLLLRPSLHPSAQLLLPVYMLQSKWPLMVAGCLRRVGRLEDALLQYREVYRMTPTNMEALRYLAQLSQVGLVAAPALPAVDGA